MRRSIDLLFLPESLEIESVKLKVLEKFRQISRACIQSSLWYNFANHSGQIYNLSANFLYDSESRSLVM